MVSVSCYEFVFCKSNVCFGSVVVFAIYSRLVNDWRQFPSSGHEFMCRQLHLLFFSEVCSLTWWMEDELVVIVNDVFDVVHDAVA